MHSPSRPLPRQWTLTWCVKLDRGFYVQVLKSIYTSAKCAQRISVVRSLVSCLTSQAENKA